MKHMLQSLKVKGFTLIEMVIVILLVGILAAVAIPAFVNLTVDAETAALDAGQGGLKSAVAIYMAQNNGAWPTGDQLASAMEGANDCATYGGASSISLEGIAGAFTVVMGANSCTSSITALSSITTHNP